MSIYVLNTEPTLTAFADGDLVAVYDADGKVIKSGTVELLREYMGAGLVEVTASDALTAAEHGNRMVTMNALAGLTLTLPAATGTGNVYKISVSVTVTSNDYIIQVANATDEFLGGIIQTDVDTTDTLASYPALDADGFDTITLNGTTTGGILGDSITITDIATGKFLLAGSINSTGTVATPLTAAV